MVKDDLYQVEQHEEQNERDEDSQSYADDQDNWNDAAEEGDEEDDNPNEDENDGNDINHAEQHIFDVGFFDGEQQGGLDEIMNMLRNNHNILGLEEGLLQQFMNSINLRGVRKIQVKSCDQCNQVYYNDKEHNCDENKNKILNQVCPVCLEEFTQKENGDKNKKQFTILPCKHIVHANCYNMLQQQNIHNCIVCNKSILFEPIYKQNFNKDLHRFQNSVINVGEQQNVVNIECQLCNNVVPMLHQIINKYYCEKCKLFSGQQVQGAQQQTYEDYIEYIVENEQKYPQNIPTKQFFEDYFCNKCKHEAQVAGRQQFLQTVEGLLGIVFSDDNQTLQQLCDMVNQNDKDFRSLSQMVDIFTNMMQFE